MYIYKNIFELIILNIYNNSNGNQGLKTSREHPNTSFLSSLFFCYRTWVNFIYLI